jgi:undecaprenyl-diphosphatase
MTGDRDHLPAGAGSAPLERRTMSRRAAMVHPQGVLLVTAALFCALALFATLVGLVPADAMVRDTLLGLASPAVVAAMRVVNMAGDWRLLLPGTLLLPLLLPRARARWWLWMAMMLVAAALPDVVKVVVARARPEDTSLGFPSGHATAAAAFFGAVLYLAGSLPPPARRTVRAGALVAVALVGVARVVLRAHWPSDVVGGAALGLALAAAAALIDASSSSAGRGRARTGS